MCRGRQMDLLLSSKPSEYSSFYLNAWLVFRVSSSVALQPVGLPNIEPLQDVAIHFK